MKLLELKPSNISKILDSHDIEIRSKGNPIWYHAPLIWVQIAIVWASGRSPSSFSLTLPTWGGASVYLSGHDVQQIRDGNAPNSAMPIVVHELTHAMQILEFGAVRFAVLYTIWPLPVYWTGRSTLEWQADANEILWLRQKYSYGTEGWVDRLIESSAQVFTSSTYLWPTTDAEGWRRALRRFLGTARMVDNVDARDDEFASLASLFNGYEIEGTDA
jgi:hypothetical protein